MQNVVQVMVIQLIHVFLKVKTKEFYFFSLKESSTIKESSRIQHKKNSINEYWQDWRNLGRFRILAIN
ncbi:unnamed protein product [Rhizophagus irregularis]|nr:unnamed protein product [Rhizophagus irregularis]